MNKYEIVMICVALAGVVWAITQREKIRTYAE